MPNLFPFKAQVIESLQRKKKEKDDEKKLQKLKNKPQVSSELDLAGASNRSKEFEEKFAQNYDSDQDDNNPNALVGKEKRRYVKELKKVLEASDVGNHFFFLLYFNDHIFSLFIFFLSVNFASYLTFSIYSFNEKIKIKI